MTSTKLAHISSFLSLLLLLALAAAASPAHAGIRICKSNYTDSNDRRRLRTAMERVMPPGVPLNGIPDICRNRSSASASLDTWAQLRPDGVTEWWSILCGRESRDWRCDSPIHTGLIWVHAEVGGIMRRLEVSFDDETTLARAQRLAVQAVRIIQDSSAMPIPACGEPFTAESQRNWEKTRLMYALKPEDTVVELAIESQEPGVAHVTRNGGSGLGLTFTDDSSRPAGSSRACWAEWIVIG